MGTPSITVVVNKHWALHMADKFVFTFKSACLGSLCKMLDFSSIISVLERLFINIHTLWLSIAEDYNLAIDKLFAMVSHA